MPTIYGKPAVLVRQPSGEDVPYMVEENTTGPDERAAWVLTSPEYDPATGRGLYRVVLSRARGWWCSCRDFEFRGRANRRAEPGQLCKHGESCLTAFGGQLCGQTENPGSATGSLAGSAATR